MRIVLLTRTGRPSGEKILAALLAANKNVVGVIAEKRTGVLLKNGICAFARQSIRAHGCGFLAARMLELLKSIVRGSKDSIKGLCRENTVPFYLVENHNDNSTRDILMSIRPEVMVTANTRIIKGHILKIPTQAAINFHTGKLPRYAGLDSIFWALYHAENEIGVTVHHLREGLDTGDILNQETIPVTAQDDLRSLTAKANDLGARLIVATIEKFEKGDFFGTPQDISRRTYFTWPTPAQRRELNRRLKKGLRGNFA